VPLAIRTAGAEDAAALVALINRAFAVEKVFVDGERTSLDEIAGYVRKGLFLVADRPDPDPAAPIACAYIEQRGYRAYLGMLAVDPSQQGKGIGREMMAAVEAFCRRRRVRAIDIRIVDLRTELPPFYRSLGFVEEGTAPYENVHATQPAHFILMSKNLQ
jgi:ribosomal protein S18 acetylase RimI-like enzyme